MLPLEARPDSTGEHGMQPRDACLPWRPKRTGEGPNVVLPRPARGAGTLIPSAQRLVWVGVVEIWAAELRVPSCADSLNAALAHSPLRNCQRRGFPRGGHSIQPLHTPGAPAAAPPPHKMAAPIEETAAASSAPFCGRREICQHGIPPLRMHLSLEILLKLSCSGEGNDNPL